MFVVKSVVNSKMFVVFFVIKQFFAISLSSKVLLYEINIWINRRYIHTARWLPLAKSYFTCRRRTPYRRMETAPTSIPKTAPQSAILQSTPFRQAPRTPCWYRRIGTGTLFSDGKRLRRKRRCQRIAQISRPNDVGT